MTEHVEVRRSARARRWRLEVPWGAPVRLTVPRSVSAGEIERVLADRREWIELQRREQVPQLGLDRVVAGESELRAAARRAVSEVAAAEAVTLGVRYERIRIGGQRTVWGSCSARSTLSFNWRLVLAPASVLDYVVVHELCHLVIPNHSKQFWALVEGARPRWRDQREWLRRHGPELLGFRPSRGDRR